MSNPPISDIESPPSLVGRISGGGIACDQPDHRGTGSLAGARPRVSVSQEPGVEWTLRANAGRSEATETVLSASQFECFLERERSLADRGTRRFSLLFLRRRTGAPGASRGRDALAELAQQARKRLRSTDLVGRLDRNRVQILLTDTGPAGAEVVAVWVDRVAAQLGVDLEHTIYVYPSVTEPDPDPDSRPRNDGPHEREPANGHGNGRLIGHRTGAANGHVPPVGAVGVATNGKATHGQRADLGPDAAPATSGRTDGVARDGRARMLDLWPFLVVPTPWTKRCLDIVFSVLALVLLSPLFVLTAIAIRVDSPGPVIFRQTRAGRGARPFEFYKFRSMTADAEELRVALAAQNEQSGPIFKIREDPRITRVGRFLRRWSIDELPQLWNVLKGDISLVGPRSPTLDEVGKYERWHRRRLSVTGGVTCTWQVSGRSEIPFQDWMRLDVRYVVRRLVAQTLPAVISGRGAC